MRHTTLQTPSSYYIIPRDGNVSNLPNSTKFHIKERSAMSMTDLYSTEEFERKYTYLGPDLGARWTKEKTAFRVWAPTADAVQVNLYESGTEGTKDLTERIDLTADIRI